MAKIALNPDADQITPTAPAASAALANPVNLPSQFEGEFTSADTAIPYLAICQKSGKMMDDNPGWLGNLIYNKELDLGKSVKAVFFRVRKYLLEDIPYGSDVIPRKFDTSAEAREAAVDVVDVAELDCLIEVPAAYDGGVAIGASHFAPARYVVRSTAYRATVPVLRKDLGLRLNNDLTNGFYTLSVEKKTYGANSWFAPNLSASGAPPDEVRAFIAEKFL